MPTTILNEITQQYHNATNGWYSYLFPIASRLFGLLAVIELAWSGIWWACEKSDVSSLWTELLKKILVIGFFYTIMLNAQSWIPAIIQSFEMAGSGASHFNSLYPSDVFDQGVSLASALFIPLQKAGWTDIGNIGGWLIGGLAAIIILLAFAVISALLVVTLVESYIVVGAGVLMLGFSGSRWTSQFAANYLSYAVSVGAKLFVLFLVVGVGATVSSHWASILPTEELKNFTPLLEVLGGSVVFMMIALSVPSKAASIVSGASHSTFGTLSAAMGVAVGAAMVPTSTAFGTTSALKQAVIQGGNIAKNHSNNGGNAVASAAKGILGASANLGVSALGSAVGHYRSTSGAMADKTQAIQQKQFKQAETNAAYRTTYNNSINSQTNQNSNSSFSNTNQSSVRPNNPAPPYSFHAHPHHVPTVAQAPSFVMSHSTGNNTNAN